MGSMLETLGSSALFLPLESRFGGRPPTERVRRDVAIGGDLQATARPGSPADDIGAGRLDAGAAVSAAIGVGAVSEESGSPDSLKYDAGAARR